jgi:LuxR family transcriptional regulator, quorum-sensing system regulator CviR
MSDTGMAPANDLYSQLTKRDLVNLLEIMDKSLHVASQSDLSSLLQDLQNLVPSEHTICALAETTLGGRYVGPLQLINVSYPTDWLSRYIEEDYANVDPILQYHFNHYDAQDWSQTYRLAQTRKERVFAGEAASFHLTQGITVGVKSLAQPMGSLFSFSGPQMGEHPYHAAILQQLAPHLHQALLRLTFLPLAADPLLSNREREVLLWIKEGKTNWEISIILMISERTVRFHVANVLNKLQASTRGHAVAVALQHGLIAL